MVVGSNGKLSIFLLASIHMIFSNSAGTGWVSLMVVRVRFMHLSTSSRVARCTSKGLWW